jgi:hypothetical protein
VQWQPKCGNIADSGMLLLQQNCSLKAACAAATMRKVSMMQHDAATSYKILEWFTQPFAPAELLGQQTRRLPPR